MNKYKEAFKKIKDVVVFNKNYSEHQNNLEDIEELVDKTVPCKPIYDKHYSYDFKCKCGGHVRGYEDFCHNCGQALDWSEDE